jgi:hypothetical protein
VLQEERKNPSKSTNKLINAAQFYYAVIQLVHYITDSLLTPYITV